MVGVAGFEPAAHWSQTSCATKLRYTPIFCLVHIGRGSRIRTHGTWFWRPLLYQLSYTPTRVRRTLLIRKYGGEDGIRTHAALANPNDLANRPLQPLEYFSRLNFVINTYKLPVTSRQTLNHQWRRGWDSNPRPLSESLVFKTSSLNHSDTSPHAINF